MRLTPGDEEVRERLGHDDRLRLGPVNIEMAQCLGDPPTAPHRAGELRSAPPGS
ncbi:MAG TPA: hypothetical protein VIJ51_11665 [Solirubrobacteraceae bacterium]